MTKISLKLDVLKPHRPSNLEIAQELVQLKGVTLVDITVDEIDQKTTSVFLRIEGNEEMDFEVVEEKLEELNCALHSVDQVTIEKND